MRAAILTFPGADFLDVLGPYRVFSAVNDLATDTLEVLLAAAERGRVELSHGITVDARTSLGACPPLDALVVPGGSSDRTDVGRRAAQRDERILGFVRTIDRHVTASVCTGAFVLAEAGLLAGRRANTHWAWRTELTKLMSARGEPFELVPERVVWDGDLVTGGGVTSGIDIALSIVERLCGEQTMRAVRAVLERETPG